MKDNRGGVVFFGLVCIGSLLLIQRAESYWGIASYVASAAGALSFLLGFILINRPYVPGTLRMSSTVSSVRLMPGLGLATLVWSLSLITVAWGAAGVLLIVLEYRKDPSAFSFLEVPKSVFAIIGLAVMVSSLGMLLIANHFRLRTGLYLTEDGVTASDGAKIQELAWSDLLRATIEPHKSGYSTLVILDRYGRRSVSIGDGRFGSDPMPTAALIHYFRDHPEERHLLSDPERAIERFLMSLRSS